MTEGLPRGSTRGRQTKERRPRASSRGQLLHAFTELVAERGYDDTSISDVAAVVGVSKGTIVHHFQNKQQMLELSHLDYIQRRLREAYLVMETVPDVPRQLAGMIHCLFRAHRYDYAANKAFLREFTRFATGGSPELRALRDEYTSIVAGILRRGVSTGTLRDVDVRLTSLQLFGMCNYAWTWYRPEGSQTPEQIAVTFANNLLGGLLAPLTQGSNVEVTLEWVTELNSLLDTNSKS